MQYYGIMCVYYEILLPYYEISLPMKFICQINDIFYVDFKLAIPPMEKTAKCHVDTVKMEKYVIA